MAENREYLTRAEENGSINIAEDVVAAIAAAVFVYVLAAVFTKAITRDEVVHMPKGERIAALLRLK